MPNEATTDPQDTPHPAAQNSADQEASGESPAVDAEQAEDSLEELSKAPALEEDEDSLVKPENS